MAEPLLARVTGRVLGSVFWRHIASICIAVTLAAGPTLFAAGVIWSELQNTDKGLQKGLDDHSGVLKDLKDRIVPIERSLADGTGPLTIRTQGEDIKDMKTFVAEQRELNGSLKVQVQGATEAVKDVKSDVAKVKEDTASMKSTLQAILANLRMRSEQP